jgi:pimeloyl-ACP methyl ester carboxylesterase
MTMTRPREFAVWPKAGAPVSLATGAGEVRAFVQTTLRPPSFPRDAARGNGQPVIAIPGLSSPDMTTARMRMFLKRQGFSAYGWAQGPNIGPTAGAIRKMLAEVERVSERYGTKVALIGPSLGGVVAREIAKRRPECVSRVITLASPIRLPVPTPLAPVVRLIALAWEDGADAPVAELQKPPPVPLTAIVTRDDGLVDWQSCVPDPAPNVEVVEVRGAHTTIMSNPDAQRVVAERLARD